MSELLLFSVGFVFFVMTTVATLMFGYQRFNALYAADQQASAREVSSDGYTEFYTGESAT